MTYSTIDKVLLVLLFIALKEQLVLQGEQEQLGLLDLLAQLVPLVILGQLVL